MDYDTYSTTTLLSLEYDTNAATNNMVDVNKDPTEQVPASSGTSSNAPEPNGQSQRGKRPRAGGRARMALGLTSHSRRARDHDRPAIGARIARMVMPHVYKPRRGAQRAANTVLRLHT